MDLRLEDGKTYLNRYGERVTVTALPEDDYWYSTGYRFANVEDFEMTYMPDGIFDKHETEWKQNDLIAPWEDEQPAQAQAYTSAPDTGETTREPLTIKGIVSDPQPVHLPVFRSPDYETELRDRVAVAALEGLFRQPINKVNGQLRTHLTAPEFAIASYQIADAFMSARKRGA